MPETRVLFYREDDGSVPVLEWLRDLRRRNQRAYARCRARITTLGRLGHELRRPQADFLRDGIYELRAREGNVNYRVLYFFHGRNVAVVAHGLVKEAKVPTGDIERAIQRKAAFEKDPDRHTFEES